MLFAMLRLMNNQCSSADYKNKNSIHSVQSINQSINRYNENEEDAMTRYWVEWKDMFFLINIWSRHG
jgi:hypothetical protein